MPFVMKPGFINSDRRASSREYLMRVVNAEILYGFKKIHIDTGRIGDVSANGIGVRPNNSIHLKPKMPITIAAQQDGSIISISGRVASINYGHVGIEVVDDHHGALRNLTDRHQERVTISPPVAGVSRISGMLSMFARHPMHWAINLGAQRFDLSQVNQMDSSGIGLLLLMRQLYQINIENCPPRTCQLVNLCRHPDLCGNCPKRSVAD
jgi:hypothetical protein